MRANVGWIALAICVLALVIGVLVIGPQRVYDFTDNHHGFATAVATAVIGLFTIMLGVVAWYQLRHGQKVERAYLTGGGDIVVDPLTGRPVLDSAGRMQFRVDVGNYGKTPAYLTHYDVHFDVLANVQAELKRVSKSKRHDDRLAPGGHEKAVGVEPVTTPNADVVYGAFWYRDIWNDEHRFRFILSINQHNRTRPDVVGVDVRYGEWD
jgi:hypothetical protein